jgi:hypothetical protein
MRAKPNVEYLGQPCRAKNILSGRIIIDPESGQERLVLVSSNEATNLELLFIDFENDTGTIYRAPAGSGAWALKLISNNRLAIGTHYDGKFLIFDLVKKEYIKTISFPGESYLWNFALGNDGRLYTGTYSGAKLGALNLETYDLETRDSPTIPSNLYLRSVNATADGKIICSYINAQKQMFQFDPGTKQFSAITGISELFANTALWNGYLCSANKIYDGISLKPIDLLPFPLPSKTQAVDTKPDWAILTNLTSNDTIYFRFGNSIYRFSKGDKEPVLVATNLDSRYIRGLLAVSKTGKLVGVFGQNYYVITPGIKEVVLRPIPVTGGERPMLFIKPDGNGKLWTGPHFGQTLCSVDLKSMVPTNTGNISNHGGEVYDVSFYHDSVYAVAYAGGEIIEYNPSQPWDQWHGKNPRTIAKVGPEYIRPLAGICTGADNKLYSGWMAEYGKYGGAIAITDPETGKTELIKDPLGQQAVSGLAVGEGKLFIGTTLAGNGLPTNPNGKASFGIIDIESRKVLYKYAFDAKDIPTIYNLGFDTKTRIVIMAGNTQIYLFDLAKMSFRKTADTLPKVNGAITVSGDGFAYYGSGTELIKLDLAKGKVTDNISIPAKVDKIAIDKDNSIYLTSGPSLYRVK